MTKEDLSPDKAVNIYGNLISTGMIAMYWNGNIEHNNTILSTLNFTSEGWKRKPVDKNYPKPKYRSE